MRHPLESHTIGPLAAGEGGPAGTPGMTPVACRVPLWSRRAYGPRAPGSADAGRHLRSPETQNSRNPEFRRSLAGRGGHSGQSGPAGLLENWNRGNLGRLALALGRAAKGEGVYPVTRRG